MENINAYIESYHVHVINTGGISFVLTSFPFGTTFTISIILNLQQLLLYDYIQYNTTTAITKFNCNNNTKSLKNQIKIKTNQDNVILWKHGLTETTVYFIG